MSRFRGAVPVLLATAIGIGNGLYIFGPAFKEQRQEKEEQARKAVEVARLSQDGNHKTPEDLRDAEAAASRTIATESALKPVEKASSWWPNMSLWTKEVNKPTPNDSAKTGQETPKDKP
ncbi:hypothetical protein ONS95_007300 [Cadophora gregata]|uniref:uncharacterized protein n=1 Tax=Cadophora gregata TaxID=51156 RepID=UPI0026DCBBE7|nr:uncharacterized protein ONS95_007300 [Cadophora gregata]KAK0100853.1 hypothetical protein ONS95_007300 [Cadophora gregata]KAK0117154.1 hypothetical protein ONS96_012988 [Cadophora gregata f. sp. sojae]